MICEDEREKYVNKVLRVSGFFNFWCRGVVRRGGLGFLVFTMEGRFFVLVGMERVFYVVS